MEISNIKLIIWDLDETFWAGTLSEESVTLLEENTTLVKHLVDCGIMNSICSKNDYDSAKSILEESGLWDYFIFPKISWQPKGEIIRDLITEMNLRSCNVLFIDDNPSNLNEAKYYSPELLTALPDCLPELIRQASTLHISDKSHKRLVQYRVLEQKQAESRSCLCFGRRRCSWRSCYRCSRSI